MRKNKFKIISIIVLLSILLTLIPIRNIIIKAENKSDPSFSIDKMTAKPDSSILGDDITISGRIKPEEFDVQTLEQELVIVLDVSKNDSNGDFHKIVNPLKNFIDALGKDKKSNINLKIGIIIYDDKGEISQINNNKLVDLISSSKAIKDYFGNIKPNKNESNKNIGDALRKAIYLLNSSESNPNSNKTILLIAEGNTDSRLVYNNYGNFCLDTTKEVVESTEIVNNNEEKGLEYAKDIGSIIKDKGYNIFTMGIGSSKKNGNNDIEKEKETLRQIHASMTGYNDLDNTNCEEKGLFLETANPSSNENYITDILSQISNKISNEYYLNNVSLNFEFDNNITLKYGGNSIKLENIKYTLDGDSKMYKAKPIEFSFIVNAKKIGEQNVFKNLNINYSWKNENKVQDLTRDLNITVQNNNYPDISAQLLTSNIMEINNDEEISIKYRINPKDFIYSNSSNEKENDVLFLIDIARNKKDNGDYFNIINNDIIDSIYNKTINSDSLKKINTRYSIITFNSEAKVILDFKHLPNIDSGNYENSINQDYIKLIKESGEERDIGKALLLVKEAFSTARSTSTKNIVIIANKDVSYNKNDYKDIINKDYNIITLSYNNKESISNLYNLHKELGGRSDDIIYSENDTNIVRNSNFDTITEKIIKSKRNIYYEFNPIIKLDLNNNFEPISGIQLIPDNNIGIVKVPTIKYNLILNNSYHADDNTLEIKIRAKNLNYGTYRFGNNSNNIMIYNNIIGDYIEVNIETPIIIVKPKVSNVSHGIYNGIVDNKVDIKENTIVNGEVKSLILAETSTLTIGSTFNTSSNSIKLSLDVDENFEAVKTSDIIVYKVINNDGVETLEIIKKIDNSSIDSSGYKIVSSDGQTNKFIISINDFNKENKDTKILIVYKGSIKENVSDKQLINKIDFGSGVFKDFIIDISVDTEEAPKLPDLF